MAKSEKENPAAAPVEGSGIFLRTFLLLTFLVIVSVLGTLQTYWTFNEEAITARISQQIVSTTNLTRFALVSADPLVRPELLGILASEEGLQIAPREESDKTKPLPNSTPMHMIEERVLEDLGEDTVLASEVNGEKGLWVSVAIGGDQYWLMTRRNIFDMPSGTSWLWWGALAFFLSVLGATMLTRYAMEPLANLSKFARTLGRGEKPEPLPDAGLKEFREVNRSFNKMMRDLMHMEEDREVLLAGISHDLRTPITRLRLEVEMADLSEDTRGSMIQDMVQMENIVNQFLAYTRKSKDPPQLVNLGEIVETALQDFAKGGDPSIAVESVIRKDVLIVAHPVEISRVVQNLLVNAGNYGRNEEGKLELFVNTGIRAGNAILSVSDRGPGIAKDQMERVLRPFERGEQARTGSSGTGLGLAIVDRISRRYGGVVRLSSTMPHGLTVEIVWPAGKPSK